MLIIELLNVKQSSKFSKIHSTGDALVELFNKTDLQFLSVQTIEQVGSNATNIEEILWRREKYWQSQLFTKTHGMNSLTDFYCSKRKGYRK